MSEAGPAGPITGAPPPQEERRRRGGEALMVPPATPRSYYGHPVLKAPVWKPEIAAYFWTGGLGGASAVLAAAARARGNDVLARRALLTGLGAVAVSPPLLIMDLGVRSRFLNMLRVFKVTSPMSVGSWILSGTGFALGVAAGCDVLGLLPRLQRVAEVSAAALGAPLATYTAALLADTAVPVWHEAFAELPFVFAGSAASSAGAAGVLLTPVTHAGLARRVAVGGAVVEVAAAQVMERRLGRLAGPYEHGQPRLFSRLAVGLSLGGAAVVAASGRRRAVAAAGAAAVLAGSMAERWAIFTAGPVSAKDPAYTVAPQRDRLQQDGRPSG